MCGIAGFYECNGRTGRQELHARAAAMAAAIAHRGPDGQGVWQDPDTPLVLAHRRLSVIDLSPEGAQPMESHSGRYLIAYNGEIYNFLTLRRDLEEKGTVFRGRSDTEVILAALDCYGLGQTLQKLNGMFAFALWDRQDRRLTLARDPLGKKPLYIGWAGKSLVFGSELKALCAHPDFSTRLNRDTLALYMRYGYVPAPHCIYKNVFSLPPGHVVSLAVEALEPGASLIAAAQPFWHPLRIVEEVKIHAAPKTESEAVAGFETLLAACTAERMIADVPLGAFLSGGIDSSTITAIMQQRTEKPVKTYTIGFHESGFDEAAHAAKISQHLGTDHHEIYLGAQDAMNVIPLLPSMYDEPFADISQIPTYLVSHFARAEVTVALSGDGGDETLGGYTRHLQGPRLQQKMKMLPRPLRRFAGRTAQAFPVSLWDRLRPGRPQFGAHVHKAAALFAAGEPDSLWRTLVSRWDDPEALVLQAQEPALSYDAPFSFGLSPAEDMMLRDTLTYLPGDILTKVDRASMACGLEIRAPLLDRRIFDYVWGLPLSMKIRDGEGKWLLRRVLSRHVPHHLFERPKQGFSVPVGEWLRGPLKDWAESLLDETRLEQEGYFNAAPVHRAWTEHLQGKGNHAGRLWTVLMFQAWQERWL